MLLTVRGRDGWRDNERLDRCSYQLNHEETEVPLQMHILSGLYAFIFVLGTHVALVMAIHTHTHLLLLQGLGRALLVLAITK